MTVKTIVIRYNPATVNLDADEDDLYGYLRNELEADKVRVEITALEPGAGLFEHVNNVLGDLPAELREG